MGFYGYIRPIYDRTSEHCRACLADVRQARDCSGGEQAEARQRGNLEACGGYQGCFPKECSELVDAEDASKGYRLEVVSYDDLTIDLAHRMGARFLVRGVRSAKDFEYEREQADINKQLGGVETILLFRTQDTAASAQRWSGS